MRTWKFRIHYSERSSQKTSVRRYFNNIFTDFAEFIVKFSEIEMSRPTRELMLTSLTHANIQVRETATVAQIRTICDKHMINSAFSGNSAENFDGIRTRSATDVSPIQ